jgi:hypothetical protein
MELYNCGGSDCAYTHVLMTIYYVMTVYHFIITRNCRAGSAGSSSSGVVLSAPQLQTCDDDASSDSNSNDSSGNSRVATVAVTAQQCMLYKTLHLT